MKSLLNFTSILNIIAVVSCGLPDVTSITQEMNQPFITKLTPGDNKITVEFQAQNNEPAFSGYNIYFGDSVNPQKYRLYNSQKSRPTILVGASQNIKTYTFTIEPKGYYSEGSGEVLTLTEYQLQNGIPIYVWVSAYQITPQAESYYYYDNYVKMATPRPEYLNQIINSGDAIRIGSRQLTTLSGTTGNLQFQNVANGTMQMTVGTSLNDITVPPTDGYGSASLTVTAQRLYLVKITEGSDNYYGKIFVHSVNGGSVTIDYCHQPSANILSY